MTSEVDICNLALSHLGDTATVASIDPPEGSAQAEHCARFYPIARDNLLELHAWKFATRRAILPLLSTTMNQWRYVYGLPNDYLRVWAVMDEAATADDFQYGTPTAQAFAMETLEDGTQVVLTNQENALVKFTVRVTDTTKFSPLFVTTLSHHLASMLAGPLIKGDAGKAEAKAQAGLMQAYLARATVSDADQQRVDVEHVPNWMASRAMFSSGWRR